MLDIDPTNYATMTMSDAATPAEGRALFNNCRHIMVMKDDDGRFWEVYRGTDPDGAGFKHDRGGVDRFTTLHAALREVEHSFPSLPHWRFFRSFENNPQTAKPLNAMAHHYAAQQRAKRQLPT